MCVLKMNMIILRACWKINKSSFTLFILQKIYDLKHDQQIIFLAGNTAVNQKEINKENYNIEWMKKSRINLCHILLLFQYYIEK